MKLTQPELAAHLDVTLPVIHAWECDKTTLNECEMLKLSSKLLVPVATLQSWANTVDVSKWEIHMH